MRYRIRITFDEYNLMYTIRYTENKTGLTVAARVPLEALKRPSTLRSVRRSMKTALARYKAPQKPWYRRLWEKVTLS